MKQNYSHGKLGPCDSDRQWFQNKLPITFISIAEWNIWTSRKSAERLTVSLGLTWPFSGLSVTWLTPSSSLLSLTLRKHLLGHLTSSLWDQGWVSYSQAGSWVSFKNVTILHNTLDLSELVVWDEGCQDMLNFSWDRVQPTTLWQSFWTKLCLTPTSWS